MYLLLMYVLCMYIYSTIYVCTTLMYYNDLMFGYGSIEDIDEPFRIIHTANAVPNIT